MAPQMSSKSHKRSSGSTHGLLNYNIKLGHDITLPKKTEQKFIGVFSQVYPLKASLTRLTEFCDSYLNFSDDTEDFQEWMVAKPAAPMVFMQVLHYGKMAVEPGDIGWFSQREVAFGIPLGWQHRKKMEDGYTVEPALVYPFIYVDKLSFDLQQSRSVWLGEERHAHRMLIPAIRPNVPHRLFSLYLETSSTASGKRQEGLPDSAIH